MQAISSWSSDHCKCSHDNRTHRLLWVPSLSMEQPWCSSHRRMLKQVLNDLLNIHVCIHVFYTYPYLGWRHFKTLTYLGRKWENLSPYLNATSKMVEGLKFVCEENIQSLIFIWWRHH